MIYVKRGTAPPALKSRAVQAKLNTAARFFSVPAEQRRQQRYKFYPAALIEGVREALVKTFHSKCAYCESPVQGPSDYDIDSFRPRNRAVNHNGDLSPDHYWWLIYEWDNLVICCPTCNKLKGPRFPIEGTRAEVNTTDHEQLRAEKPLLLNPCYDHPEEELLFDEKGKVASDTKRGRTTIEVLGLNRSTLVELRREDLKELRMRWDTMLAAAKSLTSTDGRRFLWHFLNPSRPFLAMRYQFINQWSTEVMSRRPELTTALARALSFRTALTRKAEESAPREVAGRAVVPKGGRKASKRSRKAAPSSKKAAPSAKQLKSALKETVADYATYEKKSEAFSVSKEGDKTSYFSKTRLIERIEIKNFKLIENLSLQFPAETPDKGSWLLLLGENGTGKSSILQAVALALMGKRHRTHLKLNASQFVRHGRERGHVKIYLTGASEPVELHFKKGSRLFSAKPEDPKVLLLGYGSTRLLPRVGVSAATRPSVPHTEAAKADNLFNPFIPLNDAAPWLWALADDEFDRIARALKDLMLLKTKDRLIRNPKNRKRIEVEAFGTQVTLEDLSDGYQSVVALTTDIMSVMRLRWPAMEIAEGIVLIDEIDAHLHPSWKMQIVQRLRAVFPRLQFLVTSHDPLTLRGLRAGEVIVLRANQKNRPVAITDLPSPEGMRVDQLLTSEYFGLNSTVDPATEEKFQEYYRLLALRRRTKAQEERLAALKKEMESLELLGTTRREQMMLAAADEYLAKSPPSAAADLTLKSQTRKKLLGMWKKLA